MRISLGYRNSQTTSMLKNILWLPRGNSTGLAADEENPDNLAIKDVPNNLPAAMPTPATIAPNKPRGA